MAAKTKAQDEQLASTSYLKKQETRSFKTLLKQVESEYALAFAFMKPKFDEWALRLALYNNQRRDKTAIGDPLLFTIHQTVLASLYDDRLAVAFSPRERGDVDTAENLTYLAQFDYSEMDKDMVDYDWDWDAGFFGRALKDMRGWDRERQCPIQYVVDPMTFLRDPRAAGVHGDRYGRNRMRFGGKVFRMTKQEMQDEGTYFNLDKLKDAPKADERSVFAINQMLRSSAQGHDDITQFRKLEGQNAEYELIAWLTQWYGKKVEIVTSSDFKQVFRYEELKDNEWPLIDRALYPMAHDWDGVSIPDLVEDKQRGRAAVANLGMDTIKAGLYPMYLFDTNKVKNRNDLNIGFNKHVGVDGNPDGAVVPMQRKGIDSGVEFILEFLDRAAQVATATPQLQQGQTSSQQRTLGELQLIDKKVDTRYSLSAKIFGWSEKAEWRRWYKMYKWYFKSDIDEKIVRIAGALAPKWRTLTRENIVANVDPDIEIESKVVSEAKRWNKLQGYQNFMTMALTDPNSNKRMMTKTYGKLLGLDRDDIENAMPETIDEMKAKVENALLNDNKKAEVDIHDDHVAHLEEHNKAADTAAKYAHIEAHKRAMYLIKKNPDLAQPAGTQQAGTAGQPTGAANPQADTMGKMVKAPADVGAGSPTNPGQTQ